MGHDCGPPGSPEASADGEVSAATVEKEKNWEKCPKGMKRGGWRVQREKAQRALKAAKLAGDEDAAEELFADKAARRQAVTIALDGFDGSETGWLSREEAEDLFARLARGIVTELAEGSRAPEIARIHARRVLEDDVRFLTTPVCSFCRCLDTGARPGQADES